MSQDPEYHLLKSDLIIPIRIFKMGIPILEFTFAFAIIEFQLENTNGEAGFHNSVSGICNSTFNSEIPIVQY